MLGKFWRENIDECLCTNLLDGKILANLLFQPFLEGKTLANDIGGLASVHTRVSKQELNYFYFLTCLSRCEH